MQSKVKLTKRQIKEDKFTTFMLTSKSRFQENAQFYIIGLVVLVLAVSAIGYFINSQSAKELEASSRFSQALMDFSSGDSQIALIGLTQVVEDYSGTEAAPQAAFLLGKINLSNRAYQDAISRFEAFLAGFDGTRLNRAAALAGIGTAHEDQGKFAEAAEYYLRAIDEYPGGPMEPDYDLSAIRCFVEVGDFATANTRLEHLKSEFAGTPQHDRAVIIMAEKGNG